jgi:HSP20 family protein
VDIREDDDHLYVEAELPGIKADDVNLTLENGMLTVHARKEERNREGSQHASEIRAIASKSRRLGP